MQESRAAGVVAALRKRLQVNARVRRDSSWQVIPARELVPGDIVRVRPGDIIPADVKLLMGAGTRPGDSENVGRTSAWITPLSIALYQRHCPCQ
jgi:high-affinity K+ transport system ATPase subunit B